MIIARVMGALCLIGGAALGGTGASGDEKEAESVLDFTVDDINGSPVELDAYRGDVLLVVNVASKCGLTDDNYKGLQSIYDKYREKGFRVLGFPANNFGAQEPGDNKQIKAFCADKYGVSFDLFSKVSVKGDDVCPLYEYLTHHPNKDVAGEVEWNFQKYLVGRDGNVIAKFSPRVAPTDQKLVGAIEEALRQAAQRSGD